MYQEVRWHFYHWDREFGAKKSIQTSVNKPTLIFLVTSPPFTTPSLDPFMLLIHYKVIVSGSKKYKSLLFWSHLGSSFSCENSSVQFSCSVVSDFLQPHGLQHTRPPCPSPTPRVYSSSCPLSWWCHPTISSSVIPFFHLLSFPASGSFQMSQFFASGGQSIGLSASASVLPMNIQDWFPLGWTGWIPLQSKGLSSIFSNTTVQKHQFFSAQLSL